MMTRYTLTVPMLDNAGCSIADVHAHVERTLIADYPGGFTRHDGTGYWGGVHAGREPVRVYVVDSARPIHALHALARYVARAAAQDCVYVTAAPITTFLVTP